jgi:hypothetical protein
VGVDVSRFRYGVSPYVAPSGRERGKALLIETMISDYQILHQTDDQIMKSIDKFFRYHLNSRRLYLQAEDILNGDENT